ncbi:unnamed protein product [Paramecium sonneborni]|uniref:RING-type domain-containing protein n=1 Tax=Paramecium sonneborni TaxID=65129 RepID=A0A8S1L8R5_9CILI|nr:unnamed protein product [Paramecium sonneborni]
MILFLFYFFITGLGIKTINFNEDYLNGEELFELEDSDYFVIQEIENGTMFFQVTSTDTQKYIQIELIFLAPGDGKVNLSFTISKNSLPSLKDNKTISSTYADVNGYYLRKSYQNIVIPANSFRSGDQFYITNLKREKDQTYQYNIRIKKSDSTPCPNDCTSASYGFCNLGTCACEPNRVDMDCSKKATPLMIDKRMDNITVSGIEYFYFEQITQLETILLDVGISNILIAEYSSIFVYFMFENFKYGVPTPYYNNYSFTFSPDSKTKSLIIDVSGLNSNPDLNRFNRLILSIVVPDTCQFYFNISIPSEDSEVNTNLMLIYFLVSLAVVLVLTWIIVTLIRYRQRNRVQNEIQFNQQQSNQQQRRGQKSGISVQQLDHFMQKTLWKNLDQNQRIKERKMDHRQFEACTVCLIEYDKDSICRVTPCVHVFHSDCLQQWMVEKKHETCPMCREELNEQALEKFAEQEKNNHRKENSALKKIEIKNRPENTLMVIQQQRSSQQFS